MFLVRLLCIAVLTIAFWPIAFMGYFVFLMSDLACGESFTTAKQHAGELFREIFFFWKN